MFRGIKFLDNRLKSSALNKMFQSIPKADGEDDDEFVECDEW
jgi:hypothetical protein